MSANVPPFSITAKVVSVNGVAPTSQVFTWYIGGPFYDPGTQPAISNTVTTTGTALSASMTMDSTRVATLMSDPNNFRLADGLQTADPIMHDFGMATLTLSPCVNQTNVEGVLHIDEGNLDIPFTAELFKGQVGFYIYRRGTSGRPQQAGIATGKSFRQYHQLYFDKVAELVGPTDPPLPANIAITDHIEPGDYDKGNIRVCFQILRRMGRNTIHINDRGTVFDLMSAAHKQIMDEVGIPKAKFGIYYMPQNGMKHQTPYPVDGGTFEITPEDLAEWADYWLGRLTAGGMTASQFVTFALADERIWSYPAELAGGNYSADGGIADQDGINTDSSGAVNTVGRALFQTYLQTLVDESGAAVTPAFFGLSSWSDATALGVSMRNGTLSQRRLFYWSTRYFPDHYARSNAMATTALQNKFGSHLWTFANMYNYNGRGFTPQDSGAYPSDKARADWAVGGPAWLEAGRLQAFASYLGEDFFSDTMSWQWGNMASRLGSAARKNSPNAVVGAYQHGKVIQTEWGAKRKAWSVLAHGGKYIHYYYFGPEAMAPSQTYSEHMWNANALQNTENLVKGTTAVAAMVGRNEDLLWPGKPLTTNPVAILHPRSSETWDEGPFTEEGPVDLTSSSVDHMVETHGIHRMLTHANIQADWLEEEDILATTFTNARYKVLYVTGPNIPAAVQTKISNWVNTGGVVITTPSAAMWDRYNDALTTLGTLGGIAPAARTRRRVGSLHAMNDFSQVNDLATSTSVSALGDSAGIPNFRTNMADPTGGTVVARFNDNSQAAVVHVPHGTGKHVHFNFFPGMTYIRYGGSPPVGQMPNMPDFTAAALFRTWAVNLPVFTLAGVTRPVETPTFVEAPPLTSSAGWAIPLINWSPSTQGAMTIKCRTAFTPTSILSDVHGNRTSTMTNTGDGYTFTLPSLADVDVVRVYSGEAPPPPPSLSTEMWGMVPI